MSKHKELEEKYLEAKEITNKSKGALGELLKVLKDNKPTMKKPYDEATENEFEMRRDKPPHVVLKLVDEDTKRAYSRIWIYNQRDEEDI
jgi:hypothetical protein